MSEHLSISGRKAPALEWPTLILATVIYGAFALLTLNYDTLPLWVLVPAGAFVVAWHSSLQHEVAHGHPTRWPWVNRLLVLPNLWLWMPFEFYRESHLCHHRDENLTVPGVDPESFYQEPAALLRRPRYQRLAFSVLNSLGGRLLFQPLVCLVRVGRSALAGLLRGEVSRWPVWLLHFVGVLLPLLWATQAAGMALWEYVVYFAYPGISLALLRSFLEHRAVPEVRERTVLVEAGPLFSLLFLNNNLHAVHHDRPGLPWYRIPAVYRQNKGYYLTRNGGYHFDGYWQIAARYLFKPKEPVAHPGFLELPRQPTLEPMGTGASPLRPGRVRAEG